MYDNPKRPPFNPFKLLILMIIAIVVVIGATYALNGGGKPTSDVENNTTNGTDNATAFSSQATLVGNSSAGSVYKYSGYGNAASDVKVALIIGINEDSSKPESVLPTLENIGNLQYSYDVYLVNATNLESSDDNVTSNSSDSNNTTSNSSVNTDSEDLAKKYVVSDIENGDYDFTAQIQSSNNGSYLFVPSEDTYTSKEVVNNISNSTGIKKQMPRNYNFAKAASIPLIEDNVPSMVYMTSTYYSAEPSDDIAQVIGGIDSFDFNGLYTSTQSDTSDSGNVSSDNSSSKNSSLNNTTSNSSKKSNMKVTNEIDN